MHFDTLKASSHPKRCGTQILGVTEHLLGCAVSAMTRGTVAIAFLVLHTAAAMPILTSAAFCAAPAIFNPSGNLHLGGANVRTMRPDVVAAGAGTFGFDDDEKDIHPLAQTMQEFAKHTRVYTGAFAEHAASHHIHAKHALGILSALKHA
jgi:hypothetical protein